MEKIRMNKIGDLCFISRKNIVPKSGTIYKLYSLPAFDNHQKPEIIDGNEIMSSKLKMSKNLILYNKLNVRFKRVWNIHDISEENEICSSEFIPLKVNSSLVDQDYLYYILISDKLTETMHVARKGTSNSQQRIDPNFLLNFQVKLPSIDTQRKIASLLRKIDNKIRVNESIVENLLEQVDTLYVDTFKNNNVQREVIKASDYFDITIGKTPPRKEFQWFSKSSSDIKWLSISDMGLSGVYSADTKEKLTYDAVKKFNIIVVPENTVLLSFKLTVGRVTIANEELTTNEAIAHFKTNNKNIVPYLYCYLKRFKYSELGSTSSIATAVNSKLIKAMPFVVPNEDELKDFNKLALSSFKIIKNCELENNTLLQLRDSLIKELISDNQNLENESAIEE